MVKFEKIIGGGGGGCGDDRSRYDSGNHNSSGGDGDSSVGGGSGGSGLGGSRNERGGGGGGGGRHHCRSGRGSSGGGGRSSNSQDDNGSCHHGCSSERSGGGRTSHSNGDGGGSGGGGGGSGSGSGSYQSSSDSGDDNCSSEGGGSGCGDGCHYSSGGRGGGGIVGDKWGGRKSCKETRKRKTYGGYVIVMVIWFVLLQTVKPSLGFLSEVVEPELWVIWGSPFYIFFLLNIIIVIIAFRSGISANNTSQNEGLDIYSEFIKKSAKSSAKFESADSVTGGAGKNGRSQSNNLKAFKCNRSGRTAKNTWEGKCNGGGDL